MMRIKLPTNDHESHNCKTTSGLEFHSISISSRDVSDGVDVESLACVVRMSADAKREAKTIKWNTSLFEPHHHLEQFLRTSLRRLKMKLAINWTRCVINSRRSPSI